MTNVINLNKFRKKKKREAEDQTAEENRAKFGRTKGEKSRHNRDMDKLNSHLEQHEIDSDET